MAEEFPNLAGLTEEFPTLLYREARPYNKRQAREGGEARGERVVWRKSRGAEIGVVMLMKLEGKRPMVRAKTKKKEGDG